MIDVIDVTDVADRIVSELPHIWADTGRSGMGWRDEEARLLQRCQGILVNVSLELDSKGQS